jgi:protein EPIDERMAL PATTERNING FACTOR 1/2
MAWQDMWRQLARTYLSPDRTTNGDLTIVHLLFLCVHGAGASSGPADGAVLGEDAPAAAGSGRRTDRPDDRTAASPEEEGRGPAAEREELWAKEERRAGATGSRLPDCAHACGPCSPCRRVMVSFRCAQASESCPVAYRCMCRGRFFRVPSL